MQSSANHIKMARHEIHEIVHGSDCLKGKREITTPTSAQ